MIRIKLGFKDGISEMYIKQSCLRRTQSGLIVIQRNSVSFVIPVYRGYEEKLRNQVEKWINQGIT